MHYMYTLKQFIKQLQSVIHLLLHVANVRHQVQPAVGRVN